MGGRTGQPRAAAGAPDNTALGEVQGPALCSAQDVKTGEPVALAGKGSSPSSTGTHWG